MDKLLSVQFARFVAASVVVLYHVEGILAKRFPDTASPLWTYICNVGAAGVHIFFVISGFVMVYTSFGRTPPTPGSFIASRFVRIYPTYWVYAVLYLAVWQFIEPSHYSRFSIADLTSAFFLLPDNASNIIVPGWTLPFEIYFYTCFAAILLFKPRVGLQLLTGFFLASIAAGAAFKPQNGILRMMSVPLLLEFIAGAWLAYFVLNGFRISRLGAFSILFVSACAFLVSGVIGYSRFPYVISWGVPSILLVSGLVFLEFGGTLPSVVRRLSPLGNSSYSLYLLNGIMIETVVRAIAPVYYPSVAAQFILCAVLTVACISAAIIPYEFIEKRILRAFKIINAGYRTRTAV